MKEPDHEEFPAPSRPAERNRSLAWLLDNIDDLDAILEERRRRQWLYSTIRWILITAAATVVGVSTLTTALKEIAKTWGGLR